MKKSIQLVALFALTLLGSCTGGNEQKAAEKVEELNTAKIKESNKIGIMAGASTPKESIDNVIEKI